MPYDPGALRPGDIILCLSSGALLDRLIAWSQGPFVHAALVGDGHLVEQVWTAREADLDEYAAIGWAYRVQASDEGRRAAVAWAEGHLGAPYDVEELLRDAARFDLHVWPRRLPRLRRWTCSGFVATAYAAAGVILTHAPYCSPVDLACSPLLIGPRPWEE
jgi:hypothetical protein